MENTPNIRQLFIKYLDNSIDKEDFEQLQKYFGEETSREELHNLIINALYDEHYFEQEKELQHTVDRVEQRLRRRLQPEKAKTIWLRRYLPYAAIILLSIVFGISYYILNNAKHNAVAVIEDVNPGTRGATLTLANGKKIRLNSNIGHIADEGNVSIDNKKGELQYSIENDEITTESSNTLSTGNGETYSIVLPDGTKVWLNAATTLRYAPTKLERMERVVWVAGEAYFEVAKDKKHPFIVTSNAQKIEVLGTHFNVNTYKADGSAITTLAEGSVKVSTDRNSNYLKPGQQAITDGGTITIETADLETALAWKNGKAYFKDAPLEEVMDEIARWYNVQVKYEVKPAKALFNGGFSRSTKLSEVLEILKASNIQGKLIKENNQVTLIINSNKT